eukprot:CAMPEP_0172738532 /NCGR_PEP_ID=MMETSP1074-20121228/120420_1 /TAXON_ID=2916 /ORGANISM="Ceratium fusus, Strain PA161109" /LENGTH=176 /DNA_ID=CAMNT_0013568181 /DNA_START=536 /DNA_END=1067 /DNA_ORIENTATION=-
MAFLNDGRNTSLVFELLFVFPSIRVRCNGRTYSGLQRLWLNVVWRLRLRHMACNRGLLYACECEHVFSGRHVLRNGHHPLVIMDLRTFLTSGICVLGIDAFIFNNGSVRAIACRHSSATPNSNGSSDFATDAATFASTAASMAREPNSSQVSTANKPCTDGSFSPVTQQHSTLEPT